VESTRLSGPLSIPDWSRDPRLRGDKPYGKTGFQPRLRGAMLFPIALKINLRLIDSD
jgi:hypothetical protein